MNEFCQKCETLLMDGRVCDCGEYTPKEYSVSTVRVWFNQKKELLIPGENIDNSDAEGPKVEKYCSRCSALTEQTYFTAQLRSADEGQTVFYRCTICLIQTSENS